MDGSKLSRMLRTEPVILLSGPIETRLAHEFGRPSPGNASFVQLFEPDGRRALGRIYASYMQVAVDHGLPMIVDTPTWRAHPDGLARQGFVEAGDLRRVNAAALDLVQAVRRDVAGEDSIAIAGVIGPRLDGYDPRGAPAPAAAQVYHGAQVEVLAELGVDMFYAPTIPSADELRGMAAAFATTGLPYVLAPVIGGDGRLPDGCPIRDVVDLVAATVSPAPSLFAGGCVHPSDMRSALVAAGWRTGGDLTGIAANGSALPRDVLEHLDHDESDDPAAFADGLIGLHRRGFRLLGGCCGTTDAHLRALAERLRRGSPQRAGGAAGD